MDDFTSTIILRSHSHISREKEKEEEEKKKKEKKKPGSCLLLFHRRTVFSNVTYCYIKKQANKQTKTHI